MSANSSLISARTEIYTGVKSLLDLIENNSKYVKDETIKEIFSVLKKNFNALNANQSTDIDGIISDIEKYGAIYRGMSMIADKCVAEEKAEKNKVVNSIINGIVKEKEAKIALCLAEGDIEGLCKECNISEELAARCMFVYEEYEAGKVDANFTDELLQELLDGSGINALLNTNISEDEFNHGQK